MSISKPPIIVVAVVAVLWIAMMAQPAAAQIAISGGLNAAPLTPNSTGSVGSNLGLGGTMSGLAFAGPGAAHPYIQGSMNKFPALTPQQQAGQLASDIQAARNDGLDTNAAEVLQQQGQQALESNNTSAAMANFIAAEQMIGMNSRGQPQTNPGGAASSPPPGSAGAPAGGSMP